MYHSIIDFEENNIASFSGQVPRKDDVISILLDGAMSKTTFKVHWVIWDMVNCGESRAKIYVGPIDGDK